MATTTASHVMQLFEQAAQSLDAPSAKGSTSRRLEFESGAGVSPVPSPSPRGRLRSNSSSSLRRVGSTGGLVEAHCASALGERLLRTELQRIERDHEERSSRTELSHARAQLSAAEGQMAERRTCEALLLSLIHISEPTRPY